MSLLSAEQLTQMRAQATASMDQTCTLRTITPGASDSAGGQEDPTEATASVVCRVALPSGREAVITDKVSADTIYRITLPYGTAVTQTSEIDCNGHTYQVVDMNQDGSWKTAERFTARRIA